MIASGVAELSDLRGLYLDLIVKIVANTIYGDPNQFPGMASVYDPALREAGRDWPTVAHSMIGLKRLTNLWELCARAIDDGLSGDFIETGVWRGGACITMRAVLKAYGDTSRKVYCADSFAGLPAPDPERYPADSGDAHYKMEQLAVSLDEVKRNFSAYGLLDEQVVFVQGLFKDTLPTLDAERFAVIRLDGDMYESTIQALDALYPKVSAGGYIIIDDFGAVANCRAAVKDFRRQHGIEDAISWIDTDGIWWQKR